MRILPGSTIFTCTTGGRPAGETGRVTRRAKRKARPLLESNSLNLHVQCKLDNRQPFVELLIMLH